MTTANVTLEAILIDPRARTIESVAVSGATPYDAIRAGVHPDPEACGYIEHVNLGELGSRTVSGWVDEEGMLKNWDDQSFFRLRSDMQPLAGRMLILMTDEEGESVGLPETLRQHMLRMLRRDLQWVEPKDVRVPAPTFTPLGPDLQPVGEPEPLTRDGRTEWTYDNQP